jgi:type IV pilus secretin PilQ/predicted competence protein
MWNRNRIFGLFCAAALAVYSGRAIPIDAAVSNDSSAPHTSIKVLGIAEAAHHAADLSNATVADAVTSPSTDANPASDQSADINPSAATARPGINLTNAQVSVSDSGAIEMHVNDASLTEVLRMLSLKSRKNIIASKNVDGRVTANLYNVTIHEALDAILQSNGYVYRKKGNFIYVYTAKELAELDKAARVMSTRVFRLYYTPAADAMAMIKPVLSPDGLVVPSVAASKGINTSGDAGGSGTTGASTGDTGGNSYAGGDLLVVTDDTVKLAIIEKLLKEIDHRPQEVLVEATILAATLTDSNSLGVDFSVMGGVKFNQFLSAPVTTIQNAANGTLQNSVTHAGTQGYGIGQTSFTNQLPPGGLRIGFLTNNISMFVQALESVTNTTVLANPKVLSLDKQQGYVHVGRSDGYETTTVSSTTSTQTVQFLDSGTSLAFRPYIGDDGYIRMEIHPEDSNGGLTNSNLPYKTTTEVTANLMVQDGHTIVIGGLFRDSDSATRGQIPGLGNIPILGVLFRQQQDQTTRQEIIILLTPHIIKDGSAYAKLSETELKHAEDLRVGVRKGMMFFGRERLAEQAYENAVAEMNKPNPDRNVALWHLNVATNLNPTFLEAIELKEKISGRQVTDADNSSIRSFVSRSILADQSYKLPTTREVGK